MSEVPSGQFEAVGTGILLNDMPWTLALQRPVQGLMCTLKESKARTTFCSAAVIPKEVMVYLPFMLLAQFVKAAYLQVALQY